MAQDRFPPPDPAGLEGAQKDFADRILGFSLNGLGGPFAVLIHAPDLGQPLLDLGDRLRFGTGIDERLLELAILTHAAAWGDPYEWALHHGRALRAGLDPAVVEDLRHRRQPAGLAADETVIHRAAFQLAAERRLDDAAFAALCDLLGQDGAARFAVLMGQYALLSTVLAVGRVPVPQNGVPPLVPGERNP